MFNIARYCPILLDIVSYCAYHPILSIIHSLGKIDIVGLLDIFKYFQISSNNDNSCQIFSCIFKYGQIFANIVRYSLVLTDFADVVK